MPNFNWVGIDWYGNLNKGTLFAKSESELEKLLLKNEIGLVSYKLVKYTTFLKPISLSVKARFFKELSILIDSGVLLPHAIGVIKEQLNNEGFKKILLEIELEIMQGASLGEILEKYPYVFDSLMVQIVFAGQESGRLNESLILLSEYLEKEDKFNQKMRSSLLLPFITFAFFIIIALTIFLFIIPAFATIFSFSNQEIPAITQNLLDLSDFLKGHGLFILMTVIIILGFILRKLLSTVKGKLFIDKLILHLPFIGDLNRAINLTYFLQSVSLLLSGGVHLVNSLSLSSSLVKNSVLKCDFDLITNLVQQGFSLSDAIEQNKNKLFDSNLTAMVKVGQETGKLGLMLNRASNFYNEKSNKMLSFIITIIQPALMIILGLLIAALIFAVYIPLFNLPNIIK